MNLNAAFVLTLLLCVVAAAVGYWLGRRGPKSRVSNRGPGA